MGMHVFSLLKIKHTLKRNLRDKSRDADWDFGARQSPPDATDTDMGTRCDDAKTHGRRRRSASADGQRHDVQAPPSPPSPPSEERGQQHGQHNKRGVGVGVGNGNAHGSRGNTDTDTDTDTDGARINGPLSVTPEGEVLLAAAAQSAKVLRTTVAAKQADQRKHVRRSIPPDAALPSSPTSVRSMADSPTPSMHSFQSVRSGSTSRTSILVGKRSMPQLHNIWENFLEEAAEDVSSVSSFSFPMPPPHSSPNKFATVHVSPRSSISIDGNQSLRQHHHHTPTSSSSSSASTATTSASVSTVKTLPRNPLPDTQQRQATASPSSRSRGHLRASHHTSSSTSSTTASITGSTSSMAAFSSASSMTTAHDDCDDDSQTFCDDPVPATPRSSVAVSPKKSFRFAAGPPLQQRLRKSPTTPALLSHYYHHQNQTLSRGPSPSSSTSTSSESHTHNNNSTSPSSFHSQSSTPTPSSVCPSPSPTSHAPSPTSPSKHTDRVCPATSGSYRREPESELPEQPLYPGSLKGRKSLSKFYRHSRSRIDLAFSPSLDTQDEGGGDLDEDVLSELGYYGPAPSRIKSRERRQSALSTTSSLSRMSSTNSSSSELSFVPPLRRSSRQLVSIAGAQSAPPGESMLLPRAKSVSNIKHEANAPLPKRPLMMVSHSSQPALAMSSDASRYPHAAESSRGPLPTRSPLRTRSLTLQDAPALTQTARNDSAAATAAASSALVFVPHLPPSASKSSQHGRLRSGSTSSASAASPSASSAHYRTLSRSLPQRDAKAPPVRPPPAPPLDLGPSTTVRYPMVKGNRGSTISSQLTPSSAVQWGYAL